MKLGAVSYMTDYGIDPGELAAELEAHGFESMWCGDHSHVPISERHRDEPDLSGEPLMEYKHLLDPVVALTAAARATSTIKLATGMLLLAQRDPIQTAKSIASLDHISGGRMLFGVASGWNVKELRNHGTDPEQRWAVLEERLAAVRRIWRDQVAEYQGEHVSFTPLVAWPKPRRELPIVLGCDPVNLPKVVALADEWAPLVAGWSQEKLVRTIGKLQALAADAGRSRIPVTVFPLVERVEALELGSGHELGDADIRGYQEAGVDRLVVVLPPRRERTLPLLEHYARFAART